MYLYITLFLQKTNCCIKEKKMPRILGKIGEVTESSLHKVGNLGLALYFSDETCEDLEFIWEVCKMRVVKTRVADVSRKKYHQSWR